MTGRKEKTTRTSATKHRGRYERLETLRKHFDGEWVLLEHCKLDERQRLLGGVVVAHSRRRDDVYGLWPTAESASAVEYLGKAPEGLVIIL